MQEIVLTLDKRRKTAAYVIVLLSFLALIISFNFSIKAPEYFNGQYNMAFVYFLIIYKLIELPIIYYFLLHRHLKNIEAKREDEAFMKKLTKHTKLLYFLIPQGNIIFAILAYKFSENVMFVLVFSAIALFTLYFIKPSILINYIKKDKDY